jgi:hypothetical protein
VDQRDRIKVAARQLLIDVSGIDMTAPSDLQRFGVFSAAARDVEPLI